MDLIILNAHVNLLHVIVGIIVTMIIGAFWYSPMAFGKKWAKAQGVDLKTMKCDTTCYVSATLVALVTVLGIGIMLPLLKIVTIKDAIQWGILSWVTFVVTSHYSGVIWARRPLKGYLIDVSYLFVIILFNSILLTAWK